MTALTAQATLTPVVLAAAVGDDRAWDALVRRFTPMLRRVAMGYQLNAADVDDVVQGAFIALLEKVNELREPEAVGGWLVTTTRRRALRAKQREVREILVGEPVDDHHTAADSLESGVIRNERAAVLRLAVRRLPPSQRRLVETMIAAPDRSYVEVSQDLGMPIGSIGPTLGRGLRCLRADVQLAELVTH
jgi:RNA polymerase sigma factor (sigma-70 family)